MFTPKVPVNDQPTGQIIPLTNTAAMDGHPHAPTDCYCRHQAPAAATSRPTVQLTPGSLALLVGGGTAAVLVVGTVLVSLLLAVAITAGALAIVALVIRSLIHSETKRR
ncbi:SpdD-like protein [Streptomyces sp. cg35]|uniref:SpdD-like protein n=1 Tax=Streptomyces sp. cg35 TaxID=3421650 RepID=UPI003D17AD55